MEDRKVPPARRGNIDGISPRRPAGNQPAGNSPASGSQPDSQAASDQKPSKDQQTKQTKDNKQPKKGKNMLVIIPAVVVFIGLSALAVYTGMQQNSDSQGSNGTASEQDGSTVDNSELIDQTINEIDQLNDQPDNSGEGLSDDSLGL